VGVERVALARWKHTESDIDAHHQFVDGHALVVIAVAGADNGRERDQDDECAAFVRRWNGPTYFALDVEEFAWYGAGRWPRTSTGA